MNPEETLLLICTRQNFLEQHRKSLFDICHKHQLNWLRIYQTAELHGVAPLIYTNLSQFSPQDLRIPPEIIKRFRESLMANMFYKEQLASSLVRALSFLSARSINVMLIKGGALDILVYDQPYYTTFQDIDLVISINREDITEKEILEFRHFFHQSRIEYDFYKHHDVTMNGVLPVNFDSVWNDATKIEFRGHDIFVMSPEDMLISICVNSCRKRFFRLKALCDIAEFIHKYPNLDWSTLVEKARAYDSHNIVYTALYISKLTLDCQIPNHVWSDLGINSLRAGIIRSLSRHMTLSTFPSLPSESTILGRNPGLALMLPYSTLRSYQIWEKIKFITLFSRDGTPRLKPQL